MEWVRLQALIDDVTEVVFKGSVAFCQELVLVYTNVPRC